ncbi:DivIVA domain-containing protein [Actinorugispora endophytica]|uniref:Cell wall synthesis protein Wag31 n=1 Tax=Actinorugispora endophytica TaxID=1605990 RepID=A0A4V3D968_9ACTN|nr:DivIVA domain-containing protein [Actinorugispora endophytica]TDQ54940.1 DivIVA domain-containing protein [Actinorugispora endophytica]
MPLTASDVHNKRFNTSRLRPGYVQEDVDALLRRVESTLSALEQGARPGGLITASDVMGSHFRTTMVRPGYDEEEVDTFLDEVAEALRARGLYASEARTGKHSPEYFRQNAPPEPAPSPGMRPEDVRDKGFTTTRLRAGYAEEEVDEFLDRAEATIAALVSGNREEASLTASEVRAVQFSGTRLRTGYAEEEVDDFLDELADELERYGLS